MVGQHLGVSRAHVADVEARDQPPQRPRFRFCDPGQQVVDRLFAHAFQLDQLVAVVLESVNVGEILDEPRPGELFDELDAQPFNVHRAAGSEIMEALP